MTYTAAFLMGHREEYVSGTVHTSFRPPAGAPMWLCVSGGNTDLRCMTMYRCVCYALEGIIYHVHTSFGASHWDTSVAFF